MSINDLLKECKQALINRDAVECYNRGHNDCECTLCKINSWVELESIQPDYWYCDNDSSNELLDAIKVLRNCGDINWDHGGWFIKYPNEKVRYQDFFGYRPEERFIMMSKEDVIRMSIKFKECLIKQNKLWT